jgi:hypothetical protein
VDVVVVVEVVAGQLVGVKGGQQAEASRVVS